MLPHPSPARNPPRPFGHTRRPYGKVLPIENAAAAAISVTIPPDAAGKELHLIFELTDQHPDVPLVDYRRVVITVGS